ncbi:MAG: DNA-directed RNA polymerase subunit omega [Firmicutes bacterium]|nr:DNA-directed RNA polymerase subunit omega [Bacillota bacterium]
MKQPPLGELLKHVDSRYTLVVATAKRARQLLEGSKPMVEVDSNKPVTIALSEMAEGKVNYHRVREGIK